MEVKLKTRFVETLPEFNLVRSLLGHFIIRAEEKFALPFNPDWSRFNDIATGLEVAPICQKLLESEKIPVDILKMWRHAGTISLLNNIRALKATCRLFAILEKADIRAVVLRGISLIESLYIDPALRPMRDVDVLVLPESRKMMESALNDEGFEPVEHRRTQTIYNIGGTTFEIHWIFINARRYMHDFNPAELLGSRILMQTQHGDIYRLTDENELLGLVVHLFVHHELNKMHSLIDIALCMVKRDLDWESLAGWCRNSRLTRMVAFTLDYVDWLFNLGLQDQIGIFNRQRRPHEERLFEAYALRLFGEDQLAHHLRRKRNLIYVAEKPVVKFMQFFRFLSTDEILDLLKYLGIGKGKKRGNLERKLKGRMN